jgi:flagellar biosynthesis protein FlhB
MSTKELNKLVSQSIQADTRRDLVVDIVAWVVMTIFIVAAADFFYTIATRLLI